MRILLLLEPYPIRDNPLEFGDLCQGFARSFLAGETAAAARGIECRIFAAGELIAHVRKRLNCDEGPFLWPVDAEHETLQAWSKPWIPDGVAEWSQLLAGAGQVSRDYEGLLNSLYSRFPFDLLIFWGSNGAVANYCKKNNIATVFLELGCTRPPFLDTMIADPLGSNGAALLRKVSMDKVEHLMQGKARPSFVDMALYSADATVKPYDLEFGYLSDPMLARLRRRHRKLLFVPLQLPDDANLIAYSPFRGLDEVVKRVVELAHLHDWAVVFKPHPASRTRLNGTAEARRAQSELPLADEAVWIDGTYGDISTAQLVAACDGVITVNSSVGFEALFYDKPVALLGEAVFAPMQSLLSAEQLLTDAFDRQDYLHRIAALRGFMLDVPLFERSRGMQFEHLLERILGVKDAASHANCEPNAYMEALHARFGHQSFPGRTQIFLASCKVDALVSAAAAVDGPAASSDELGGEPIGSHAIVKRNALKAKAGSLVRWLSRYRDTYTIGNSDLFDAAFYQQRYPDVTPADGNLVKHFLEIGWREGRDPSPFFSLQRYYDQHQGMRDKDINPLLHYIRRRRKRRRSWLKETVSKLKEQFS